MMYSRVFEVLFSVSQAVLVKAPLSLLVQVMASALEKKNLRAHLHSVLEALRTALERDERDRREAMSIGMMVDEKSAGAFLAQAVQTAQKQIMVLMYREVMPGNRKAATPECVEMQLECFRAGTAEKGRIVGVDYDNLTAQVRMSVLTS